MYIKLWIWAAAVTKLITYQTIGEEFIHVIVLVSCFVTAQIFQMTKVRHVGYVHEESLNDMKDRLLITVYREEGPTHKWFKIEKGLMETSGVFLGA